MLKKCSTHVCSVGQDRTLKSETVRLHKESLKRGIYGPATSFGRLVPAPLRLRIAARTRLAVATASSSAASKAPGATSDAIARTAPTPCAGLRSDGTWKTAALALTAPPKVRRAEPSFLASAVRSASSLACLEEQPVHCG